jgi:hypothetical protein
MRRQPSSPITRPSSKDSGDGKSNCSKHSQSKVSNLFVKPEPAPIAPGDFQSGPVSDFSASDYDQISEIIVSLQRDNEALNSSLEVVRRVGKSKQLQQALHDLRAAERRVTEVTATLLADVQERVTATKGCRS